MQMFFVRACLESRFRQIFERFFASQGVLDGAKPNFLLGKRNEEWQKTSRKDDEMEISDRLLGNETSSCHMGCLGEQLIIRGLSYYQLPACEGMAGFRRRSMAKKKQV